MHKDMQYGHFVEYAFYRICKDVVGLDIVHCQQHAMDTKQGTDLLLFVGESEYVRIDVTIMSKWNELLPNGAKQVPVVGNKRLADEPGYGIRIGNKRGLFKHPVLVYHFPSDVVHIEGEEDALWEALYQAALKLPGVVAWYQQQFA